MDEDMVGFAHGLTSAVAATSVWECLRTFLAGWALLVVGALMSGIVFHLIHRHHQKVVAKLRRAREASFRALRGHGPLRLPPSRHARRVR